MDFKQLKKLSDLPDQELTKKLTSLFYEILKCHDAGECLSSFDWRNLQISENGSWNLAYVATIPFSNDACQRNYVDYASIIYCLCTKQKSAEAMAWDAGRRIKQPVLREIVLTICGRNSSINPLIAKLRDKYIDEETFFSGYTTVDEKEAYEAYDKAERMRIQNYEYDKNEYNKITPSSKLNSKSTWFRRIGVFILMALCIGGYKAYRASKKAKYEAGIELMKQQQEDIRNTRQRLRNLKPTNLPLRSLPKNNSIPKDSHKI